MPPTGAAHAYLPPSGAGVWVKCAAAPYMWALYPEPGDGIEAAEGTAAHWVFEQMFASIPVDIGHVAPNGVIITDEMIDGAELFVDTVRSMAGEGAVLYIERRVLIPFVSEFNWGTPDVWVYAYNPARGTLYLFDYKFGHEYVEVFENWQLLDYLCGLRDELNIDGARDQVTDVEMVIVQPRSYHRDGPVRRWARQLSDLRGYFNTLRMAAEDAMKPEPMASPGEHCKHCSGRHACEALQRAGYAAAALSMRSLPLDLSPEARGLELAMLMRAKKLLDARVSGLEESVFADVRAGYRSPGWGAESTPGRTTWLKPFEEVKSLGEMMQIDLVKPGLLTPTQAKKKGLDAALVDAYSFTPSGGLKLVADNATLARKAFQK